MLSGIKKLVKSIKEDNSILFRSKSLSPQQQRQRRHQSPPLPSYIYKNLNAATTTTTATTATATTTRVSRGSRASSLKKSFRRRECSVSLFKTVIPAMMYAKIIILINNRAYICTIDGNYTVNTIPCTMFYNLDDTRNLFFNLEHSMFHLEFIMGNKIVLGKQFAEKYVEMLDYQRGIITLKDTVKLDVYNEIPNNVITVWINDEFFLAQVDATKKHSVLPLEMLDKLQCDTTQTQVSVHCMVQTEYNIPFEFDNIFYVVDNHNKYVILGLDFMTPCCTRIGKHYIQLKNNLRAFYLK